MYDRMKKLTSVIRVEKDGDSIFYGRILSMEKNFYNTRTVVCEGELAYLLDSIQEPKAYQNHKVTWVCNRRKRKGKEACDGTRVPDTVIKGWGEIKNDIYIQRKDDKNGKKRYSYTSKKPSGIRV